MSRRGIWPRLVLAVGAAMAAVAALEVAHRVWLVASGDGYSASQTAAQATEIAGGAGSALRLPGRDDDRTDLDAALVLHPYQGYDSRLGVRRVSAQLADHLAHPERFDVLLLGGSVAEIFGRLGAPTLRETLAADPRFAGREIHFLEFGRTTYRQPQQQMLLGYLLAAGFRPDAVVNIDGFNEVTAPALNVAKGVHPLYPLGDFWLAVATLGPDGVTSIVEYAELVQAREALTARAEGLASSALRYSSVLGSWSLGQLRRQQVELAARTDAYLERLRGADRSAELGGPPFGGGLTEAVELGATSWAECSLSIAAMCRERGISYLHVLQPTLHDPGSKPATDEEKRNARLGGPWLEGTRIGYPRLRQLALQLKGKGIALFDATRVFASVEDTIYLDACHFDERGNRVFGAAIGDALLESLGAALPPRSERIR